MRKIAYVNAWEYVNPGPEAGGGGFNWYTNKAAAVRAYEADLSGVNPDWAHFYFEVELPDGVTGAQEITEFIDYSLLDYCACAETRRVGANVAAYWEQQKMNMTPKVRVSVDPRGRA
jgi:hypothetical protein